MTNFVKKNHYKTLILIFCILIFFVLKANTQNTKHTYIPYIQAKNTVYNNKYQAFSGGLGTDYFITDKISIGTGFSLGNNYFATPVTLLPGVLAMDVLLLISIIKKKAVPRWWFVFFADEIAYHIQISKNIDFAPYVSPVSFNMLTINAVQDDVKYYLPALAGLKFNTKIFKKISLQTYAEYKKPYNYPEYGFEYGLKIGYIFAPKITEKEEIKPVDFK